MDFIAFKRYVNNVTPIITNPRKRSSNFFFLVYRCKPQTWSLTFTLFIFAPSREKFVYKFYHPYRYNKTIFIGTLALFIQPIHSDCASVYTKVVPHSTPVHEQINKRSKGLLRNARYIQRETEACIVIMRAKKKRKKGERKWIRINNLFVEWTREMALSWLLGWFRFITSSVIIDAQACVVASSS